MSDVCPKLRDDLVISEQQERGTTAFVLKDPRADRFFRFGEVEGFVLRQMDGACALDSISRRVEQRFGEAISSETLTGFVTQLDGLGLLAGPTDGPAKRPRRIRGDLFYLRARLWDPDAFLRRVVSPLRFFYTRGFLALSAGTILLAIYISFAQWATIEREVLTLFQSFSLLAAILLILAVVAAHELAHGLTCKRYGGQVREIGFMLIYFMPAFYCDVSDAWLIPDKRKRLLITLAGGYFELFLWSLATILWVVTERPSVAHDAALVVAASSGLKTLFNFNPLIKLDGYYLLSDWLDMPNLRAKATTYVKAVLARPFGGKHTGEDDISHRERRAYLLYGALALVFSTWLTWSFLFHFGRYLMTEYQAVGLAAFSLFLVGLSRQRIQSFGSRLGARFGINRWSHSHMFRFVKIVVLPVVLVAGLYFLPMRLTVTGDFTIAPVNNTDIRAEMSETITAVYVDQGDSVRAGDVVARLSDRALRSDLDRINSQVDETAAKLQLAKAGARPEEITLASTRVTKAQELLEYATKELERSTILVARKIASDRELDQAKELASVRRRELEEAQSALRILTAGSRREEIQSLEAQHNALVVQKRFCESQLTLLEVRSPATGVVVTPKLKEKVGQYVASGDLIAKVFDLQHVEAEVAVSEKDIADVQLGLPVEIKARAYPDRTFLGTVSAIAPVTSEVDSLRADRTVLVRIRLDNPDLALKIGMSGTAKVLSEQSSALKLLGRKVLRFFRIEFWSWW